MTADPRVEAYFAALSPPVGKHLTGVRAVFREALPGTPEGISYGLPAYKVTGGWLYFGAFKNHWSLFGFGTEGVVTALAEELAGHVASKGTIQFRYDEPVPADLIRKMIALRVEELAAEAAAKRARAKRPKGSHEKLID